MSDILQKSSSTNVDQKILANDGQKITLTNIDQKNSSQH